MNEKKLQRLIDDSIQLLNLNEKQANYLDMLVNLAYNQGQLDKAQEYQVQLKEEEKTFKEKWEEARMK